jgi:ribonucleoside-diphosphate reductase beta chain
MTKETNTSDTKKQYSTFKSKVVDQLSQPMFLGENVNVARYDQQHYSIFEKLTERQLSYFWRPDEIDLTKDRTDFMELPENEKHIFLSNLQYQILLDSVQGRAPSIAFLRRVSLPELETFIIAWTFSESIHSRSYTHIIRNALPEPDKIFENVVLNEEIQKRAFDVTKYYDALINHDGDDLVDLRKKFILCMASVYMLEAIRFYVSFACSWAFAENGKMDGNAKIIRLIARDELLHFNATANIFKIWRSGSDGQEWVDAFNDCHNEIANMVMLTVEQEKNWATYLFKDGSMLGLNKEILCSYIEYVTNQRVSALGLAKPFKETKNPIPWINNWIKTDNVQVAPQETEIPSYMVGAVDSNLDDGELNSLSF